MVVQLAISKVYLGKGRKYICSSLKRTPTEALRSLTVWFSYSLQRSNNSSFNSFIDETLIRETHIPT